MDEVTKKANLNKRRSSKGVDKKNEDINQRSSIGVPSVDPLKNSSNNASTNQ